MSTGEKGKIDEGLVNGLKDAKSHRCHFVCVMASPKKGILLISKTKIPGPAIAAAKKDCGGTQTVEGECLYENGSYVFETPDEPDQQLAGAVKLFAKNQTTQTIKVECRSNLALRAQTQPMPMRPLPPTPNTPSRNNTNQPTTQTNRPTTPPNRPTTVPQGVQPNNRPLRQPQGPGTGPQTGQQPQPNQQTYTAFHDWRQKILQVDHATVPAAQKIQAYTKLANDLKVETDRLAQDQTIDPTAKAELVKAQKAARDLLLLRNATLSSRAQQDRNTEALSGVRKGPNQRAAAYVLGIGDKTKPLDLKKAMAPFTEKAINELAEKTDSGDSKFGSVVTALNIFRNTEASLKSGAVEYSGFMAMVKKVQDEARGYRDSHKGAITSAGKKRVKQADDVLKAINDLERQVVDKNIEFHKVLTESLAEIQRGGVCPQMRDAVDDVLKSPHLSDENRTAAQRVRAEITRLLQTKMDQALNTRPDATTSDKADLLLQYGGANPPSGKGQSDSFFIKNIDGSPAYMFKPIEGEARNNLAWSEGGGAPREILASKLTDVMKAQTNLDFGVAKTTLFKTDDDKFKSGSISKSSKRSGALQEAFQLDPKPPHTPSDFLKAGKNTNLAELYDSLNNDDVESMAILDFATLNVDRHGDNVLLQNTGKTPGQTRLKPIDAGQMLPTKDAFRISAGNLLAENVYDPTHPESLNAQRSMVTQLPQGTRPFSQNAKNAIAQMDPEAMAESLKAEYENLVSEAPEMAGKVYDDSFDLMKKSIKILKQAAAQDLTPRQLAKIYVTELPRIMDAPDQAFTAAVTQAINDLKRIEQLGGEQALQAKGINQKRFNIALQKQILEQDLNGDDAKKLHYAQMQHDLADMANYLQFENGAAFDVGDRLTRPYSPQDYDFLDSVDEYKRIGGDLMMREIFAEEPRLVDPNLKLPLGQKFFSMEKGTEVVKNGGFRVTKMKLEAKEPGKYEQFVAANDVWGLAQG